MVNLKRDYFFWKLEKMISNYIQHWLDVIENMNNENTYKLAWGRSILETIGETEINDDIIISYNELSKKIIKYYWNQLYFFNLTQGGNKKPYVEQIVRKMIDDYQNYSGNKVAVWYEKAEQYFKKDEDKYNKIINDVSSILNRDVCWRFMKVKGQSVPLYVLDKNKKTVYFSKEDAKELHEYRFVLSQLLNYRWSQLLEQFNAAPRIVNKVKGLSASKVKRNNLKKYKDILINYFKDDPIDFYTGQVLRENDISVDHVIPWSFMYSDDIWNLVLTSKSNNSKKSNNIPSIEDIKKLNKRNEDLIKYIHEDKMQNDLSEAINNHYVDKFYNSMKL